MHRVNIVALIVAFTLVVIMIAAMILRPLPSLPSPLTSSSSSSEISIILYINGVRNEFGAGAHYIPPSSYVTTLELFPSHHIFYIYTTEGYRTIFSEGYRIGKLTGRYTDHHLYLTAQEMNLGCVICGMPSDDTVITVVSRDGNNTGRNVRRGNGTMSLTGQDEFLIVPPNMKFITIDGNGTEYHYTPGIYNQFYDTTDNRVLKSGYSESSPITFTDTILVHPKRHTATTKQVASGKNAAGSFLNREFVQGVYPDTNIDSNVNRMTIWHDSSNGTRVFSTEPCGNCETCTECKLCIQCKSCKPCARCKPCKKKGSKKGSKSLKKSIKPLVRSHAAELDTSTIIIGTINGSKALMNLPIGHYPNLFINGPLEIQTSDSSTSILIKTVQNTYTYPEQSDIIASTIMDVIGISIGSSLSCPECPKCQPCPACKSCPICKPCAKCKCR